MKAKTSNVVGAIDKAIKLGLEVQKHFPEIKEGYKKGLSVAQLVAFHEKEWRKIHIFLVAGYKIMRNAFRYALKGYKGNFNDSPQEAYTGLMTPKEYQETLDKYWGKKLNAVIACGNTPFSDKEIKIIELLGEKFMGKNHTLQTNRIAMLVNRVIHKGVKIRTGKNIGCFISKRRKKYRESVATDSP